MIKKVIAKKRLTNLYKMNSSFVDIVSYWDSACSNFDTIENETNHTHTHTQTHQHVQRLTPLCLQ